MSNEALAKRQRVEALVGAVVALTGLVMAWGAFHIPGDAGYGGVGPNFLPWVVALGLALCGVGLMWQACRPPKAAEAPGLEPGIDGDAQADASSPTADWASGAWMLAGLLLNAALIERVGFIIACGLCFVLAAHGLRRAEGRRSTFVRTALDAALGVAIAAPTYWMFTKGLGIALPGLTASGWL